MDYEFVDAPPADLTCPLCMKVLCEPHMVNCCSQEYCLKCLRQWKRSNGTCPQCHSAGYAHMLMKQTGRKVGELRVYCPNKKCGCQSVLKISEYKNHLVNPLGCDYVKIECSYLCKTTVFRCRLYHHQENVCVRRPVDCTYCNLQGEYQDITGNHIDSCPSFPLLCSQKCGATVLRKDLESHREECPLEIVPCPFSELGCKVEVCRKDLEKHVELSALQHMTILAKSHISLKKENEALKKRINDTGMQLNSTLSYLSGPVRIEVAKMYPLLVDTSKVLPGTTSFLTLSEINEKAGYHYIELLEYKFKLEWEKMYEEKVCEEVPTQALAQEPCQNLKAYRKVKLQKKASTEKSKCIHTRVKRDDAMLKYHLSLYLVVKGRPELPHSLNCDVKVKVAHNHFDTLAEIRDDMLTETICGDRPGAPKVTASCDESLRLIGSIDCYVSQSLHQRCLEIYVSAVWANQ